VNPLRVAMLLGGLTVTAAAAPPALIPWPQQMQVTGGEFTLDESEPVPGAPASTRILVDAATRATGEYLATLLFKSTGRRFEVATNAGVAAVPAAILLTTNAADATLGAEGYELTVATNAVVIRAPAAAGAFYGAQTLLQLFPPEILAPEPVGGVAWTAPCLVIRDAPRFPWRGWMLDSVRHFFTPDEVRRMIDAMALHKLNILHWHLDDDSGWRIEIKKWPRLTQVGAWRSWTNSAGTPLWGLNPRSTDAWNDVGLYGGFYTQDEIRDLVAYAAQRQVTIVPEIEMPGHSTAALSAYPQFSCDGGAGDCPTCANVPHSLSVTSYVGGVFCIARPETMAFLQDVLTEVMDLFPGPFVHIGGDEVNFGNWNKHALDQQLTNSLGISSMQVYQSQFTQQIADWLKSKGRTMTGWSEIMNGGTVTNAALMDWLNTRAVQAATNRQYVVMAPSATLYINKWETATNSSGGGVIWSNEPPAQSGLCPLPNVYAFEPIPAGLPSAYTHYILGAEGPAWSEWIPSLQNLQFRVFPRLCAIAEVDWTPAAQKNWTDFTNRLEFHKQRLTRLGVNFNPYAAPPVVGAWSSNQTPAVYATLTWDLTPGITAPGEIDLSFCWKTGAHGLDIAWVALLENGVELDRDTHAGFTGVTPTRPTYVLRLPARRPGATYTLAASVQGRGGTNCNGVIYRTNWN
jgi:hexosaminidase